MIGSAFDIAFMPFAYKMFPIVLVAWLATLYFMKFLFKEELAIVPEGKFEETIPYNTMGVLLEKSNLAQDLLSNMADVMGGFKGSLALSVIFVGALIAASTGIVGATVIAMGLISLPIMLQRNYDQSLAAGTICATGTLGQIIPPSIALVILGDVLSASYQQSQLSIGNFSARTVSVGDLFMGAIIPGLMLVFAYASYVMIRAFTSEGFAPAQEARQIDNKWRVIMTTLLPPFVLITSVLGSILAALKSH